MKCRKEFPSQAEQPSKASTRPHRTVLPWFPILVKQSE
ncbi:hypothetical protein A2U01_0105237, partial [Trifolium medium]|nr:hypothetical protein [Trifolium medium]